MPLPIRYGAVTPAWYDRRMPTLEDFDGDEAAYDAALAAYVTQQNGDPAFQAPTETPFEISPGVQGTWRTAGSNRKGADGKPITKGEYEAQRLAAKMSNPSFDNVMGGYDFVAGNKLRSDPELAQQVYGAMDAQGNPILPDSVLAWMEDILGMAPSEGMNWAPPADDVAPPVESQVGGPPENYPYGPATQGPQDFEPGGFYNPNGAPADYPYGPATQGPEAFDPGGFYTQDVRPADTSGMDLTNPANPVQGPDGEPLYHEMPDGSLMAGPPMEGSRSLLSVEADPEIQEIAQATGFDPGMIARIRARRQRGGGLKGGY